MTVQSRYVLEESHTVRFEIGQYDERLPLVIDPVLVYSTYMGGSGDERAYAIAVDASGNAYFVGDTWTTTGLSSLSPGAMNQNVLVAKLNATGTGFVYATYLGGSSQDSGRGIAIDNQGNIYITGITSSPDFPVTAGAWRGSSRGGQDFFVAKLNPTGSSLLYSVVAGGGSTDAATAIGLNAAGEVYVTGYTASYRPSSHVLWHRFESDFLQVPTSRSTPHRRLFHRQVVLRDIRQLQTEDITFLNNVHNVPGPPHCRRSQTMSHAPRPYQEPECSYRVRGRMRETRYSCRRMPLPAESDDEGNQS